MNQRGFPVAIIVVIVIIIVVGWLIASNLPPEAVAALTEQCNAMETKFGLDESKNVWEDFCIDPNDEQIRTALSEVGIAESIPTDRNSIVKVNCHKEDNGSWALTYEPRPCEPNQVCIKNENEQEAQCITPDNDSETDVPETGTIPEM